MTDLYSDEEKQKYRLMLCQRCEFSHCNGNQANKCEPSTMSCSADNDANIVAKSQNLSETCPKGYWAFTNTQSGSVRVNKSGCGCGR